MTHGQVIVRKNVTAVITNKTDRMSMLIVSISWSTFDLTCSRPTNIHFNISTIKAMRVYAAALEIKDSMAPNNMKYTLMILYPSRDFIDKPSGSLWLQASVR